MILTRILALVPFLGILVGAIFLGNDSGLVIGLPVLFAWLIAWIILTSIIMAIIYMIDPANRVRHSETADS